MADDLRSARADGKAEKAREKAMRPWFKKKRFIIPLVLVVLIIIGGLAGAGGDDDEGGSDGGSSAGSDTASRLFPGRPDIKKKDIEKNIGEGADVSGFTASVIKAGTQKQINQFEDKGYLVADVTILNRDKKPQAFNTFDWKLITPQGTIIDPCFCAEQLGFADLVNGATISGKITFEVGSQVGDFYLIFDPDGFDGTRGVWKVTATTPATVAATTTIRSTATTRPTPTTVRR